MKLIVTICLTVLLPGSVISQLNCHRCFGNSYCNDANHADFIGNVWNATCINTTNSNNLDIEGDPFMNEVERAISRNILEQYDQTTLYNTTVQRQQCVTATVYEGNDIHTLRTCVVTNNLVSNQTAPSLCELIGTAIAPANYYNGTFSCRTCNNHFCNTHTLRVNDGTNRSSFASISSFVVVVITLVQFLLM